MREQPLDACGQFGSVGIDETVAVPVRECDDRHGFRTRLSPRL
jgi:hypothetical protein